MVWRWLTWFHGPARVTYTPGDTVQRELIAKGLTQARVGGRGVDTRRFHPSKRDNAWRDRWRAGPDDVVVLHVGRLAPEKGLDVLIDTWQLGRRVLGPRVVWAIAGRGPLERRLAAELPWVRRAGFLDRDDLAPLYASAEVCMLPSETETCGLVALEAMASGLPVVAADAGGVRERVEHEGSGLLGPSGDAHGFLSALPRPVIDRPTLHAVSPGARP